MPSACEKLKALKLPTKMKLLQRKIAPLEAKATKRRNHHPLKRKTLKTSKRAQCNENVSAPNLVRRIKGKKNKNMKQKKPLQTGHVTCVAVTTKGNVILKITLMPTTIKTWLGLIPNMEKCMRNEASIA